jgi:YVTN family beta-propeller protein
MKSLAKIVGVGLSILFTVFALTCAAKTPPENLVSRMPTPTGLPSPATSRNLPLRTLRDVPLSGGATRFDYQSFDQNTGRLYIAHLGDGSMAVFDVQKETPVSDVKNLARVHGVLAVPELHRVYASATGSNELVVIDDSTLQIIVRAPAGDYPDGVAYAINANKIYVSDLHGKTDTVIDAKTNQRVTTIALGGGAGNTQYDSVSERIFVTVHGQNKLAEIWSDDIH